MKRTKEVLLSNTALKITAAVLAFVLTALAAAGGVAAALMIDQNIYFTPKETVEERQFSDLALSTTSEVLSYWLDSRSEEDTVRWDLVLENSNVIGFMIETSENTHTQWGEVTGEDVFLCVHEYGEDEYDRYQFPLYGMPGKETPPSLEDKPNEHTALVALYLDPQLRVQDEFYWLHQLMEAAYVMRYWVFVITLFALAGVIWCYVYLLRAAGHRKGQAEIHPWPFTKLPADLWYGAAALGLFLMIEFVYEGTIFRGSTVFLVIGVPILFCLVLFLSMELAVRVKVGGIWKHTTLYWLGVHGKNVLQKTWRAAKEGLGALPLIWKTAVLVGGFSALELGMLLLNIWRPASLVFLWGLKTVLLVPCILVCALMMRKLQKAGKAMAAGDMHTQVDTSRMILDFKAHGEDLNHIRDGMSAAVEQRMKSERMKTALITNVSHDIKTPLTSIINYSDLICGEPCDNERITQYAEVLHRQSEKLKRLIEDLVEASKASTGNLEVNLAPCEVGVMLTQAVGEYEEKLKEANLELITRKPETPVQIMADGRRLWRIFDNLMVNISKYSQPGTRVYLTLEEEEDRVRLSFKNISRTILDISPEELMERFVRGDSARSTEGNGLGLSITKSLTELQGGTMEVAIDGDLFKVLLFFPKLKNKGI